MHDPEFLLTLFFDGFFSVKVILDVAVVLGIFPHIYSRWLNWHLQEYSTQRVSEGCVHPQGTSGLNVSKTGQPKLGATYLHRKKIILDLLSRI